MTPEELKLLVKVPVSTLESVTGLQDGELLFYDTTTPENKLKKISIDTFNNLNKLAKPLKPTDPTPTEEGLYKPTEAGTYTNAGGLIAQKGYDTLFFFDGTTWTKTEVYISNDEEVNAILNLDDSNLENSVFVPTNRDGINMGNNGDASVVYSEVDIWFNDENELQELNIFSKANNQVDIWLVDIAEDIVLFKTVKNCVVGLNTFNYSDLGYTGVISNSKNGFPSYHVIESPNETPFDFVYFFVLTLKILYTSLRFK